MKIKQERVENIFKLTRFVIIAITIIAWPTVYDTGFLVWSTLWGYVLLVVLKAIIFTHNKINFFSTSYFQLVSSTVTAKCKNHKWSNIFSCVPMLLLRIHTLNIKSQRNNLLQTCLCSLSLVLNSLSLILFLFLKPTSEWAIF